MSNYLPKEVYQQGKFELEVHPYVAVPGNIFAQGAALQYGADFKARFHRAPPQVRDIALVQLIFPRTAMFPHTRVDAWNVDKRAPGESPLEMLRCLYSEDGVVVGQHSGFYAGQPTRDIASTECGLIDTPREFNNQFEQGRFQGVTSTRFANYVVDTVAGKVFDQGMAWGYEVVQDANELNAIGMAVRAPAEVRLSKSGEHRNAIAGFLGIGADKLKDLIA